MDERETLDDVFRREYGKLTATLVRSFGTHHLEAIEDAVQRRSWRRSTGGGAGGCRRGRWPGCSRSRATG